MTAANGDEVARRRDQAERISAYLHAKTKITAGHVRELIRLESENFDTTDFWHTSAAQAGVDNFPSRKTRGLVLDLLEQLEATHVAK